ncbi:hypothetical protein BC829DRAFT_292732 [Chytridium lagenaria]|nr:hypothetical protein BC829DRAFT_292732 [Chytridium lagenaria]
MADLGLYHIYYANQFPFNELDPLLFLLESAAISSTKKKNACLARSLDLLEWLSFVYDDEGLRQRFTYWKSKLQRTDAVRGLNLVTAKLITAVEEISELYRVVTYGPLISDLALLQKSTEDMNSFSDLLIDKGQTLCEEGNYEEVGTVIGALRTVIDNLAKGKQAHLTILVMVRAAMTDSYIEPGAIDVVYDTFLGLMGYDELPLNIRAFTILAALCLVRCDNATFLFLQKYSTAVLGMMNDGGKNFERKTLTCQAYLQLSLLAETVRLFLQILLVEKIENIVQFENFKKISSSLCRSIRIFSRHFVQVMLSPETEQTRSQFFTILRMLRKPEYFSFLFSCICGVYSSMVPLDLKFDLDYFGLPAVCASSYERAVIIAESW